MQSYRKFGFNDFFLAVGYLGNQIKEFVFENELESEVKVYDTGQETLTGGRLLRLSSELKNENTFMLTYGDGIGNIDIRKLLDFHNSHGKIGTVTAVRPPARFGVMKLNGNKVEYFQEKSQTDAGWINGGFFVFNKEIFDYLLNDETVLEDSTLRALTAENQLMAYKHEDFWQCMDTLRDKEFLDELCEQGITPWL
jgi:glucose-1-phosphate cytidylyltransferase